MKNCYFLITLIFTACALAAPSYITPLAEGWEVKSIMTVGESAVNDYRMVGVPDDLGAYLNQNDS